MLLGGVVHQNVELSVLRCRLLDRLPAERLVADVPGDEQASPPFLLAFALRFLGVAVFVQVDDGDIRAFTGEGDGDGAADAAVATSDKRDPAGEFAGAAVRVVLELRTRPHLRFDAGLMVLGLRGQGLAL